MMIHQGFTWAASGLWNAIVFPDNSFSARLHPYPPSPPPQIMYRCMCILILVGKRGARVNLSQERACAHGVDNVRATKQWSARTTATRNTRKKHVKKYYGVMNTSSDCREGTSSRSLDSGNSASPITHVAGKQTSKESEEIVTGALAGARHPRSWAVE